MIPGVCQKGRSTYRRFKVKVDGKWRDQYVKLPDPDDPRFAEELARVNGRTQERQSFARGTIGALIAEFRPILAEEEMADATRSAWAYYLDLIESQHGKRLVSELDSFACYRIRDSMAAQPGKANNYMAKFKALIEFGAKRGWIAYNPVKSLKKLKTGEHEPWPAHVLRDALNEADAMLRLAIVTGLCSGQRVSDCILMQHGWHDGRIMRLRSKKTDTDAVIPMHSLWVEEIGKVERKAVTLLYDRTGKPFRDTDRIQARLRRLMRSLGYVDGEGQALYTFHGLSKNAICYFAELELSDETISAIVGKTPATVRYYSKQARKFMLAEAAADRVIAGKIERLVGKERKG